MNYTREEKVKIIVDIAKNLKSFPAKNGGSVNLYNDEYTEINREYKGDMITLANQTTDAYANMAKVYNSIAPVVEPSRTGLLLDIATTAGEGYVAHTDATKPQK